MRYACIAQHADEFTIGLMCRVLHVSRSGFYAWCTREPSVRALADDVLLAHVRVSFLESDRTYGAPRVLEDLRDQGHHVGKKRVARLMRTEGLVACPPRAAVRTTDSAHGEPVAPNRVARQFAPETQPALNRVWVSDITYVPTQAGWLFLAVVLDLASRRCVGWAMRPTLEADLALSALRMAFAARRPAPGLIHHSDRGGAVRVSRLPLAARGVRRCGEHESPRRLLGQRRRRELLCDARTRTDRPPHLGHARRSPPGNFQVRRNVVQSATAALYAGLSKSNRL